MSGLARPAKRCTHTGCRDDAMLGAARCAPHAAEQQARRFLTPAKRADPNVYHSKTYHRERAAVMRDRGHCHLVGHGTCSGPLHYHSTRPPSHAREDCAPLCQRHHMQLEQQGKAGPLARQLHIVLDMILGVDG